MRTFNLKKTFRKKYAITFKLKNLISGYPWLKGFFTNASTIVEIGRIPKDSVKIIPLKVKLFLDYLI